MLLVWHVSKVMKNIWEKGNRLNPHRTGGKNKTLNGSETYIPDLVRPSWLWQTHDLYIAPSGLIRKLKTVMKAVTSLGGKVCITDTVKPFF